MFLLPLCRTNHNDFNVQNLYRITEYFVEYLLFPKMGDLKMEAWTEVELRLKTYKRPDFTKLITDEKGLKIIREFRINGEVLYLSRSRMPVLSG